MLGNEKFQQLVFPYGIVVRKTTIHESAQKDLESLFTENLQQRVLGTVLGQRLSFLEQRLEKARGIKPNWYELVKGVKNCKEIFSIYKIKNKELNNLRILYCIKDNHVYLLCAFCEENKADYRRHAEVAKGRMKLLNE